uniref:NADH-ubiquinone oxidoreductase chain 4L n=1 Tax=Monoserius pennarius TaxID=2203294 RepID=A0AA96KGS0_9CNID|nr:NADH dehydrogenase subunit 4L [Monoserius pennarius]WNO18779.1 NADH dehydrogenase subunit 4L [Monoserius pennarius]
MNYSTIFLIIFILTVLGVILNQSNILLILIILEVMFLSLNFLILLYSWSLDNFLGQIFSLFLITLVAVESAIGLSIIIAFYKLKGSINIKLLNLLKG